MMFYKNRFFAWAIWIAALLRLFENVLYRGCLKYDTKVSSIYRNKIFISLRKQNINVIKYQAALNKNTILCIICFVSQWSNLLVSIDIRFIYLFRVVITFNIFCFALIITFHKNVELIKFVPTSTYNGILYFTRYLILSVIVFCWNY